MLLTFSLPFMASNAMQVFYSLVDMMVVGRIVGSDGLAAVSSASQVFMFMTVLCLGFSTGGQVLISQQIGGGKTDKLSHTIGTLFSSVFVLGLIMTAAGLVFHRGVLTLMNVPEQSYQMACDYMVVCSIGVLFTYGYNVVSAILRGMGDSRHPFIFIAIASAINVVLDLLFVGVFGWKTAGAALATIIGQAVSFFYALIFLSRRKEQFHFDFKLKSFLPHKEAFSSLFSLGIPFALQSCAINISMLFVNSLVNGVGVDAAAVFGVGVKIDDIVNKVTQGLTFAGSAMIGQNFSAGKTDRAKKVVFSCWTFAGIVYGVFVVLYLLFSRQMFGAFTSDAGVIELAPVFVKAILWSFPAMALMKGTISFVQGIGHAKFSLILALVDGFVLRILLSWLIGIQMDYGLFGFFLGYGLAAYGTAVPAMVYFFSGKWKKRKPISA